MKGKLDWQLKSQLAQIMKSGVPLSYNNNVDKGLQAEGIRRKYDPSRVVENQHPFDFFTPPVNIEDQLFANHLFMTI